MSSRLLLFLALTLLTSACAQMTSFLTQGKALRTDRVEATEARVRSLKLPPGFSIAVLARGLENPRMLAVSDDGTLYVTRPGQDDVLMLKLDAAGKASAPQPAVSGLRDVHGIVFRGKKVYLAAPRTVWSYDVAADGKFINQSTLISDLPSGGNHRNRTLGIGPDNMLYITVGSTCNICDEKNPENATVLRADLQGKNRKIFAKGLRNTMGFGWHPETKEMWGFDHGSDWAGNDVPPEELNKIVEGGDYGWPFCYGDKTPIPNAHEPQGSTKQQYCGRTTASTLGYQAHSSPLQAAFYQGKMFPAEYKNNIFIAFRGSWNRDPATGYKIVRVKFVNGKPTRFEDFVSGFLLSNGTEHFGRLAGVAVAKDGSLIIADDTNGVMYRVTYKK